MFKEEDTSKVGEGQAHVKSKEASEAAVACARERQCELICRSLAFMMSDMRSYHKEEGVMICTMRLPV
jgi:hypothetical protein